jgi:spore germination cell wall hydrolase CwlJ-like protein
MKNLAQGTPRVFTGALIRFAFIVTGLVLAFMVASKVTQSKMDYLRAQNASNPTTFVTVADRERELKCLAQNIYYEAGYEPFEGKVAVAQVTLNRMESGKFPDDVCGVIFQKSVIYDKVICQFSWYCENAGVRKPVNPAAYQESMAVAKKVLLEGFRLDGLKNALYYHADYVSPRWGKEKIATIGRHIFYSDNKAKTNQGQK